jgi:hypothetical protein
LSPWPRGQSRCGCSRIPLPLWGKENKTSSNSMACTDEAASYLAPARPNPMLPMSNQTNDEDVSRLEPYEGIAMSSTPHPTHPNAHFKWTIYGYRYVTVQTREAPEGAPKWPLFAGGEADPSSGCGTATAAGAATAAAVDGSGANDGGETMTWEAAGGQSGEGWQTQREPHTTH